MLHAATRLLIEKVCDLTENGQAPWRFSPDGEAVEFVTEGYRIEASDRPARFHVTTVAGRELEQADERVLSAVRPSSGWPTLADRVAEMVARARQLARTPRPAAADVPTSVSAPPIPPARPMFGAIPSFAAAQPAITRPRPPGPEAYRPWS